MKFKQWVKKHRETIANVSIIGVLSIPLIVVFVKGVKLENEEKRKTAIWEQEAQERNQNIDWDEEMALLEKMEMEELNSQIDQGVRSAIYPFDLLSKE